MIPGPRPQPLGVLPWPAGMLLLPDTPEAAQIAAQIVRGEVPSVWPDGLRFYEAALAGDEAAALALIDGDGIVEQFNRAVLGGASADLGRPADDELAALVATARYSVGETDEPPSPDGCTGEVAAMVHSARASAALAARDAQSAAAELRSAIAAAAVSPILAATLRLSLAQLLTDVGDPAGAAIVCDTAIGALPLTADRELRAHLQLTRGLARQQVAAAERGALLAVVGDLNEASKVFREESHPELFALCNEHLALAYLVMPMSDQGDRLRLGVAINALRSALRVYTPQTHPVQWVSAQVNLANALQYLPSVHQEANLDEAVQLYEEVLAHRDPAADPVGYARILSNQGNALGHLGVFGDATSRLEQARALFAEAGDADSAATVEQILAGLHEAAGSAV